MKKLLVHLSFFALFIFFAGCQSEAPVSPSETESAITLEKTWLINWSIVGSEIQISWKSYGGAKSYRVGYRASTETTITWWEYVYPSKGQNYLEYAHSISGFSGTYYFYLYAYNGKSNPIAYRTAQFTF